MNATTTAPKSLSILTEIHWREQTEAELTTWAQISVKDEKRLEDFRAGVRAGWNEAIRTLKLHGLLKITD